MTLSKTFTSFGRSLDELVVDRFRSPNHERQEGSFRSGSGIDTRDIGLSGREIDMYLSHALHTA